jgi:acyl carrier protein
MTNQEMITRLAQALGVDAGMLSMQTRASDLEEWDSMGTMNIVLMLDEIHVSLAPGQTDHLRSVEGIATLLRRNGKMGPDPDDFAGHNTKS